MFDAAEHQHEKSKETFIFVNIVQSLAVAPAANEVTGTPGCVVNAGNITFCADTLVASKTRAAQERTSLVVMVSPSGKVSHSLYINVYMCGNQINLLCVCTFCNIKFLIPPDTCQI